jgi:hypothetical protein
MDNPYLVEARAFMLQQSQPQLQKVVPRPPKGTVSIRRCHHGQYVKLLTWENEGTHDVRWVAEERVFVVGRFSTETVSLHDVGAWNRARKEGAMCPIAREVDKDWPCVEVSM